MLLDAATSLHREIGMVIDLTMADAYYDGQTEFEEKGVEMAKGSKL